MVDVTIIVPVKNDEANMRDSIQSLLDLETKRKYEIIVIDNNSTDNTIETIKDAILNKLPYLQ